MIDMSAIAGTVGSLKTLGETVKSMIEARDTAVFQAKAIELQTQILSAQSSALAAHSDQFAMLDKIRQLEEEKTALEAWNAEKERYDLHEIKPGAFAYVLKESMRAGEPAHYICAACYEHREKSILQQEERMPGRALVLVCHTCGSEIYTSGVRRSEHERRPIRRR